MPVVLRPGFQGGEVDVKDEDGLVITCPSSHGTAKTMLCMVLRGVVFLISAAHAIVLLLTTNAASWSR